MKTILLLSIPVLVAVAGCSSEPSTNPNPRRTYNVQTGRFEGPVPMPPANSDTSQRYWGKQSPLHGLLRRRASMAIRPHRIRAFRHERGVFQTLSRPHAGQGVALARKKCLH